MTKVRHYLPCVFEAPLADIELFDLLAHDFIRIVGRVPGFEENVPEDDMMDALVCYDFGRKIL